MGYAKAQQGRGSTARVVAVVSRDINWNASRACRGVARPDGRAAANAACLERAGFSGDLEYDLMLARAASEVHVFSCRVRGQFHSRSASFSLLWACPPQIPASLPSRRNFGHAFQGFMYRSMLVFMHVHSQKLG